VAHARVHVALTHGDFDHVCGVGSFPDAVVVAAAETAERVATEAPGAFEEAERLWRERWDGPARVDRVLAAEEELELGRVRARTIAAANHGADGLAYLFAEQGVLAAGDFLSSLAIPALLGSLDAMRDSCRRLLGGLDAVEWVVPGHGPVLQAEDARRVGDADLAYLDELAVVARADLPPAELAIRAYAVEPPRRSPPAFELYAERATTAWRLAEQSSR
jgi:glyoxylase-like metal-dependent hydrolase (beta-lactamase superfamily II)